MDFRRQTTGVGAHRDEVRVLLDGMDVRAFGSQGQQRTAALSMRLAEMAVMKGQMGEWPVLMLDDVMSELDPERRRLLVSHLNDVQTLITCTDKNDLAGAQVGKLLNVRAATITEEA